MTGSGNGDQYTWEQILDFSEEGLLALIFATEKDVISIRGQLDKVRSRQKKTGQYADPEWYSKALSAYRHRTLQLRMMQMRLGQFRQAREHYWAERFHLAAASLLDPKTYARLKEVADGEVQAYRARQGLAAHEGAQPNPQKPVLSSQGPAAD